MRIPAIQAGDTPIFGPLAPQVGARLAQGLFGRKAGPSGLAGGIIHVHMGLVDGCGGPYGGCAPSIADRLTTKSFT
jgi:hypothetical protein